MLARNDMINEGSRTTLVTDARWMLRHVKLLPMVSALAKVGNRIDDWMPGTNRSFLLSSEKTMPTRSPSRKRLDAKSVSGSVMPSKRCAASRNGYIPSSPSFRAVCFDLPVMGLSRSCQFQCD